MSYFHANFTDDYSLKKSQHLVTDCLATNKWQAYKQWYSSTPFYQHGLTLISAWISNYMPNKVWDEITYPFLNFNGCTIEV